MENAGIWLERIVCKFTFRFNRRRASLMHWHLTTLKPSKFQRLSKFWGTKGIPILAEIGGSFGESDVNFIYQEFQKRRA